MFVEGKAIGTAEAKPAGETLTGVEEQSSKYVADLVSLVRFSLEQQPVLAPFADSVHERFNEWLMIFINMFGKSS